MLSKGYQKIKMAPRGQLSERRLATMITLQLSGKLCSKIAPFLSCSLVFLFMFMSRDESEAN